MPSTLYLHIAVPSPLRCHFDYLPPKGANPQTLVPGIRVLVPFGRRKVVGILVGSANQSDVPQNKLRHADALLDEQALLPTELLNLLNWASEYYHAPIGEVLHSALPALLRQGKSTELTSAPCWLISDAGEEATSQTLARAPKQAALLQQLRNSDKPLQAEDFNKQHENWRAPLKSLIKRGWVIEQQQRQHLPCGDGSQQAPELTEQQQQAVESINQQLSRYACYLLDGITGSGKTEVYLNVIAEVIQQGKQALVLVPEISLTPQTVNRFRSRFKVPIAVMHSGLNDRERLLAWLAAASGEASIIIGTRSALFTPLAKPGVVIIDEEHDNSFKQQDGFRYHARDLAVLRAQRLNIPIILGTATPSLESLMNVKQQRYQKLNLDSRATGAKQASIQTIDLRHQPLNNGLSKTLIDRIGEHLSRNEQVLLFINRRGFAPTLSCHDCGWLSDCPRCDARQTFHAHAYRLRCHHCGSEQPVPPNCPECGSTALRPLGQGTERIEQTVAKLFPQFGIVRIDRDSTRRKGSMQAILDSIHNREKHILIGTQMLAKGHHFPDVTLVAILDADQGLFGADFRTSENMAQLIVQVAGRAGRAEKPGHVLVQTNHPEHPLLRTLLTKDYAAFAEQALQERQQTELPPFTSLAILRAEASDRDLPMRFLSSAYQAAQAFNTSRKVELLGPLPAPMERRAGRYRAQLLLQANSRAPLQNLLRQCLKQFDKLPDARQVRWSIDIDPADTL